MVTLGQIQHEKGELNLALATFDQTLALRPNDSSALFGRGYLLANLGDYDRAMADYDESIRLDPSFGAVYSLRGELWRQKGDLIRALADHDQAIRMNPGNDLGYVFRGDALRYKGDLAAALVDYEVVLKRAPDDIVALTSRGLTYERMGDVARARADFKKALTSKQQERANINRTSLETAKARLAALDSGALQPVIPAAPAKAASATSIPTPKAVVPVVAAGVPQQGKRIGLVIGNSNYKHVAVLANPKRDAEAVAASFRAVGFESVTLVDDSDRRRLLDALKTFTSLAERADWAVVYYAGHGIEVSGVNYLIPVEAKIAADRDITQEAVPLEQVMVAVEGARKLRLVLLDACRDNPFATQMPKSVATQPVLASSPATAGARGTRSVSRGLSEVKVSGATLVVYAAKHGQTALDGDGANSPFAVAFAQRIATPNVEINKLFRLVRDDVMEATAGRQEPYTYGSLPGREDFFFLAK
jgi:tetratricopeptide (TPR) repeat protein